MSLQEVRDQETPVRLLKNMLQTGRIPNAMLFWGPAGVGKRLAALEFAKELNCANGGGQTCGVCLACRKISHGNHPDVRIIRPEGATRLIKLREMREATAMAALRPFEARWRLVFIEDAERMVEQAQNHFLKTLEEPPSQSLFILLTEHPRQLLPTIRSRCLMVRFRALQPGTVVDLLSNIRHIAPAEAEAAAALSEGQMTRALDLVEGEKRARVLSLVEQLARGEDPSAVAEAFAKELDARREAIEAAVEAEFSEHGLQEDATPADLAQLKEALVARQNAEVTRDVADYLFLLATWYRDEMVYQATGDVSLMMNRDQVDKFAPQPGAEPGIKLAALARAQAYLGLHIPEERVLRDLFFTLAPG